MNDFENNMADRLNEEAKFPRLRENWERISGRLDAYDAGMSGGRSYQRFWQITTAVLALVAVSLVWKIRDMHRVHDQLEQRISDLQKSRSATALSLPNFDDAAASNRQTNDAENTRTKTPTANAAQTIPPIQSRFVQVPNEHITVEPEGSQPPQTPDAETRPQVPQDQYTAAQPTEAPTRSELAAFSPLPAKHPVLGHHFGKRPGILFSPAVAVAPDIIRPHREPARFRAGVQAAAGKVLTGANGISWITGGGLSVAYRSAPNFWLTFSADWLRYNVSANAYLPKCIYPTDPPKPHSSHYKLTGIEAAPRQQRLGLGLQYVLPLKSRLRPVVRIGHVWARREYGFYQFEFKKDHSQGGPTSHHTNYEVRKPDAVWVWNNWRFGAGLEYETANWVLGLGVDYSKNFSAGDPMFNAVLGKMTIQYAF